jgi:type VII secretion protein EccE
VDRRLRGQEINVNVPAPLRSGEYRLFRLLPLSVVIPAVSAGLSAALIAAAWGLPDGPVAAVGAVVFAFGLARVRGENIGVILGKRLAFVWNRIRANSAFTGPGPFDLPADDAGEGPCGVYWDGRCVVTMLRVDPPPPGLTLLAPGATGAETVVPLDELSRCLDQFDIGLASIDVLSLGARAVGDTPLARLYHQTLGPLPATAYRVVWLVLRLDPLANADAVANRGGGPGGTLRAATIATRRVANRLRALGLSVEPLTAAQLHAATKELTYHVDLAAVAEHWHSVEHDGVHLTSHEIGPDELDPELLERIWTVPSLSTTLTLRLSRCPDPRGAHETTAVSAIVRFVADRPLHQVGLAGLRPLRGQQMRALRGALPLGAAESRFGTGEFYGDAEALAGLPLPVGGCGQLIGADEHGRGVATPLFGPGVRRVEISGTLQLAQQIILRALALGARVVVHTNRHGAWRPMIDAVAAPEALSLSAWSPGAGAHLGSTVADRAANLVVFDGVAAPDTGSEATIMHLLPRGRAPERADADVTLIQALHNANTVTVRTARVETSVHMVATADEMAYLGSGFTTWRMGA